MALTRSLFPVRPASPPDALRALGQALPARVALGTSTWSFPGWAGEVWATSESTERLAHEGLPAYAAHPIFRTVGIDRTFHGPVDAETFAAYAEQVPAGFTFVVKAWSALTVAQLDGQPNPHFLNPETFHARVLAPAVAGLGAKLGPIVVQLPPQPPPPDFVPRLRALLASAPAEVLLAVEPRTPALLGPPYARALADHGAVHVLSVHPAVPDLRAQWRLAGVAHGRALVMRWNLHRGHRYAEAKAAWAPFSRVREPDAPTREALAGALAWAVDRGLPAWLTVNNKAEGCAPATVRAVAERLLARQSSSTSST